MSFNSQDLPKEMVKPSKLAHVVLRTANFPKMVEFYKTFLGATASFENDMMAFLRYDDEHHRIGILALPGTTEKVPHAAGLAHIAFTFDSLSELLTGYLQRKEHGISPFWCINHGPTVSIYYKDPDGNQIETQVDALDAEGAQEFMFSKAYRENPIGVDFVPEELIQKLEEGVDEKELVVRPSIGPRGLPNFL